MTQFLEKYTFHFIWKGCVWEAVGDQTELQHIDPHSIGHNPVSFQLVWSPTDWISCALSYIIVQRPPSSCGHHKSHSLNLSTVKVIYPDIPRLDVPVIYTGAFPILTARPGRRSICNMNSNQKSSLLDSQTTLRSPHPLFLHLILYSAQLTETI